MNKICIKVYHSYEEANEAALNDSLLMTPVQRVAAVNIIRRRIFALKGIQADNKVIRTISYGKR